MRKDHHIESHTRIPYVTYQKLVKSKKDAESINKRLCSILDEYFQMKEAEEAQKKEAVS